MIEVSSPRKCTRGKEEKKNAPGRIDGNYLLNTTYSKDGGGGSCVRA